EALRPQVPDALGLALLADAVRAALLAERHLGGQLPADTRQPAAGAGVERSDPTQRQNTGRPAAGHDGSHDLVVLERGPPSLEERAHPLLVPAAGAAPEDRPEGARDWVLQEEGPAFRPHLPDQLAEGRLGELVGIVDLLQEPAELVLEPIAIVLAGHG